MGVVVSALVLALAAAAAAASPPASAPAGPVVVEEVVAVVRNPPASPPRPLLLTRLIEEARIVLASRGAVGAAFRQIDAPVLRATLEWVLDQGLLSDEANRLRLAQVSREQVIAELVRFRAQFSGEAEYQRFLEVAELSEDEVSAVLARTLRVERYLETRLGRGGGVSDEDVQRYARERGLSASSRAAREAVRARMGEERVEVAVRELMAELRGRADIRVLDPDLGAAVPGTVVR